MICPRCGGHMKVISFLTDYAVVDRIINHLQLAFVADKPPSPHLAYQELLMAAETSAEYFLCFLKMVGWVNRDQEARSAGAAKKEGLII